MSKDVEWNGYSDLKWQKKKRIVSTQDREKKMLAQKYNTVFSSLVIIHLNENRQETNRAQRPENKQQSTQL